MGKLIDIHDDLVMDESELNLMIEVDENDNPINHPFLLENLVDNKPSDFLDNPKKYGFVKFVRKNIHWIPSSKIGVFDGYKWNETEKYFEDTWNVIDR